MERNPTERRDPRCREEDAQVHAEADDMPTEEEEAAAERAGKPDPEVAEHYKEMTERGADQKGEGRLP